MRQKLKPGQDLNEVQADLIETVCCEYASGSSVRAVAKKLEISPMKARKILITGGLWTTERSREVAELYERLGSVSRVAEELGLSIGLVTTYLPYRRIVYDLDEKSGNARRIDRWRERRKTK